MTIGGAAVWIATRGLQIDVDPDEKIAMTAGLREIIDHAASGDMKCTGSKPDAAACGLRPHQLRFSCSRQWLAKLAVIDGGPVFHKAGHTLIYAPADLDA